MERFMRFCFWVCFPFVFFGCALYILDSCFVLGFLYGGWFFGRRCPCGEFDIGRALHEVARHWGLSMPSRFASLPSIVDMGLFFLSWFIGALFFGLNLLGVFLLWADWVGLPFRWLHQYGQCRVFFARVRYLWGYG